MFTKLFKTGEEVKRAFKRAGLVDLTEKGLGSHVSKMRPKNVWGCELREALETAVQLKLQHQTVSQRSAAKQEKHLT